MLNDDRPRSNRPSIFANRLTAARMIWWFTVLSVCVTVVAFAFTIVYVVVPTERRDQVTKARVDHTHQTIDAITGILTSAADAETGQRGFLLTGDTTFLAPYDDGINTIRQRLASAHLLMADNQSQLGRLQVLRDLIDHKLAELARTIDLARGGDFETARNMVREGGGKALMDTMRGTITDMIAEENQLLHARRLDYATTQEWSHGKRCGGHTLPLAPRI